MSRSLRRLLVKMANRGTWLERNAILLDEFTTDESAPLTSPRTCEPGPGTITRYRDPDDVVEIAGSKLHFKVVAAPTGTAVYYASRDGSPADFSTEGGMAVAFKIHSLAGKDYVQIGQGQSDNAYIRTPYFYLTTSNRLQMTTYGSGSVSLEEYANSERQAILIHCDNRTFWVLDGKLVWVSTASTRTAMYPKLDRISTVSPGNQESEMDDWLLVDLPAGGYTEYASEYGIATNRVASPSSPESTTSEADSWDEITWTVVAAETLEFFIRRTDDTHAWIVRCDQAAGTIKLIEVNGGETERSSVAQTWMATTAYRVIVIADDESIITAVDTAPKNTYGSASFNKTATGVKVSGFASAADLICWPRLPRLPSELKP